MATQISIPPSYPHKEGKLMRSAPDLYQKTTWQPWEEIFNANPAMVVSPQNDRTANLSLAAPRGVSQADGQVHSANLRETLRTQLCLAPFHLLVLPQVPSPPGPLTRPQSEHIRARVPDTGSAARQMVLAPRSRHLLQGGRAGPWPQRLNGGERGGLGDNLAAPLLSRAPLTPGARCRCSRHLTKVLTPLKKESADPYHRTAADFLSQSPRRLCDP